MKDSLTDNLVSLDTININKLILPSYDDFLNICQEVILGCIKMYLEAKPTPNGRKMLRIILEYNGMATDYCLSNEQYNKACEQFNTFRKMEINRYCILN